METLIYIAIIVVSYFVAQSMAPKPKTPKPAAFEDFQFPQAEEGTPQTVVFGDVWSGDWTVLALGNYSTSPIRKG